jgi:hypothetical protein
MRVKLGIMNETDNREKKADKRMKSFLRAREFEAMKPIRGPKLFVRL